VAESAQAGASQGGAAEVIVVGAGLAGLNAALELTDAGVDVLVLEASDRVGGRVHTVDFGDGPIEAGATTYGPTHRRGLALLKRFAVPTVSFDEYITFAYSVNGVLSDAEGWPTSAGNKLRGDEREILPSRIDNYYMQAFLPFERLEDWADPKYAQYDVSFADFLRGKGVSDEAIRLVNMCINTDDVEKVSALSIFRDALKWREIGYTDPKNFNQYGDDQYRPVLAPAGNEQMPRAMAAALARPVEFNRRVVEVAQTAGGVTVTCADGSTFHGKRVIVTAPIVTLRNIRFDPPLPDLHAQAIASAKASGNTQFLLRLKRRFWEEDGLPPSIWTDTIFERLFVTEPDGPAPRVKVWINGDNAARVDALGAGAGEALLETLAERRPSTRGALEVVRKVSWGGDPLIGGEKYVLAPGDVRRYGAHLSDPVGLIHWAGEHHKSLDQGMEAALQSGERAAGEVLEILKQTARPEGRADALT
jgi:monoamine oxidase